MHSNFFIANVYYKNSVWQAIHVLDTAEGFFQLVFFTNPQQTFFLGDALKAAINLHLFQFFQTTDRRTYGVEIGEHAAQPAMINIRHTGTDRFFHDRCARCALGTNE